MLPRQLKIAKVLDRRQKNLVMVLEDIHDPHNAGAILRTCDAFGIQDVYLIYENEKYYNPQKVGAGSSSSANKWLTYHEFRSTKDCLTDLKNMNFKICATLLDENAQSLNKLDFKNNQPIALLVGNEHRGISDTARNMADQLIYIPMLGMVQSLNVSVAAAVCLWEITRQRLAS